MASVPVTVIIPVYNHQHYIEQCLRSIAETDRPPQEIILVDNASTDATVATAEALGIPSLRIIRNESNLRARGARAVGVAAARNDFVAFLDSDDYYGPDAVALAHDALEEHDLDVSLFHLLLVDEQGNELPSSITEPSSVIDGNAAFALTLGRWAIHGFMLVRKEIYARADAELQDAWHSSDEILTRLIFLHSRRIMGSPGVYHYRQVPKPATWDRIVGQTRTNLRVLQIGHERRRHLPSEAPLRAMRNVVARNLLGLAIRAARGQGDTADVRDLHRDYSRLGLAFRAADLRYLLMGWAVGALLAARRATASA